MVYMLQAVNKALHLTVCNAYCCYYILTKKSYDLEDEASYMLFDTLNI